MPTNLKVAVSAVLAPTPGAGAGAFDATLTDALQAVASAVELRSLALSSDAPVALEVGAGVKLVCVKSRGADVTVRVTSPAGVEQAVRGTLLVLSTTEAATAVEIERRAGVDTSVDVLLAQID